MKAWGFCLGLAVSGFVWGQSLPVKWEELTAGDFVKAVERAGGVCMLPFGIIEKHGPAGPLGTDLVNVRHLTVSAAKQEYAVVFPEYYFGQIFEARHQPGTVAYSARLQLELLQETAAEMSRNGCKKIVIVNGHGGNVSLLQYFSQTQLDSAKDYVVYAYLGGLGPENQLPAAARATKAGVDGHAGEQEIARVMASRPELAHPERSGSESGADLKRLDLPQGLYTGIWWYARFPNHYAGDSSGSTAARGQAVFELQVEKLKNVIQAVKADQVAPRLQREFYERGARPMETRQGR
jgi:creatinine amidohydrolase